jgi:hypothetical protein
VKRTTVKLNVKSENLKVISIWVFAVMLVKFLYIGFVLKNLEIILRGFCEDFFDRSGLGK